MDNSLVVVTVRDDFIEVSMLLAIMKNKFLLVTVALLSANSIGTATDLTSGGLGLSRQSWEAKQGKPDSKCPGDLPFTCYEGGKYMVGYMNDYIWILEIYPYPLPYTYKKPGISIEESRSLSKRFIPADGRLIKTYKSRSGSSVDLYMSESLKSLESHFPANAPGVWTGGEVGNFMVIHSGTDSVRRIVIGTGNNP